jgi:YfiH family protein
MRSSFTNRTGGVSLGAFESLNLGTHVGDDLGDVLANRSILSEEFGPIQFMNQVHGDRIALIEEVSDEVPTADSLVSGIPGINLAVMVADCIPLLLKSNDAVAAVHVGRRGLVNDVTRKTINVMREIGPSKISAIIGPAICGNCYEVSEEIYQEVVEVHPDAACKTPHGTFSLDLPAALRKVLVEEGIEVTDEFQCTFENQDYFSYRRDRTTGRQAGIISL